MKVMRQDQGSNLRPEYQSEGASNWPMGPGNIDISDKPTNFLFYKQTSFILFSVS